MLVSKTYAQMTVRVPPLIRAQIDLLAATEGGSVGDVIQRAIAGYVAGLPPATKKAIDELGKAAGKRARRRHE